MDRVNLPNWCPTLRGWIATLAFVAVFAIGWVLLWRAWVRVDELRGNRTAYTEYRFEYEIWGLSAMPDRIVQLEMDLEYDAMPDLHVERAVFEYDGSVIAEIDPMWFAEPSERFWVKDSPRATPDWIRIESRDGPALVALFRHFLYPYSILAYAALPALAVRPLRVRLVDSTLLGGLMVQRGFPLILGVVLGFLVRALLRSFARKGDP